MGSVLKSVTQVATKAHKEARDLGSKPSWCLGAMPQQGPYRSGWPVLPLGGHGVIQAQAAAKGQAWVCDPTLARVGTDGSDSCCHCGPRGCPGSDQSRLVPEGQDACRSAWSVLLPTATVMSGPELHGDT